MKKKKRKVMFYGIKLKDLLSLGSILGALFLGWYGLNRKIDNIDQRLTQIEVEVKQLGVEVKQSSSLLNNYLTWRFLYLHDPTRKNIEPRYDPNKKTLEFFDKDSTNGK